MGVHDRFWSASLEELKLGYCYDREEDSYACLVCGAKFLNGEVFKLPGEERFFEARRFAGYHVTEEHGSMLEYLLAMDKKATGLTDLQKELIRDFAAGLSDAEIVRRSGSGSASTIRNHRFVLKEKAKQARLLLAAIELMEAGAPKFVAIHRTATRVDERYALTEAEYENLIKRYFPQGPEGPLTEFPGKEKRKIAVLRHIAAFFNPGEIYSEKEVNEVLKRTYNKDYVTLRRYLVEYGYLERKDDGSAYWVKQENGGGAKMEQRNGAAQARGGEKTAAAGEQSRPDKATRKQLTAEYRERKREMGVYQIKNEANGRIFVGGSANLDGLWNKEKFTLDMGTHMNKELQREWKKFGGQNFSFLILETVKTDQEIRYDYKDVFNEEGREPGEIVRQYRKQVERLKEAWLEKLQPYGEKGYH